MSFNEDYHFSGQFSSSGFPFLDPQPQGMDASGAAQARDSVFSDDVSFQIPHFLYSSAPNVATGGGVEVFPLGMPPQNWISNSGFHNSGKKVDDYDDQPQTRARIAPPLPPPNPTPQTTSAAAATAASTTLGLPIYSATGFDLLSVLARVATRPNPRVPLGPVDMSCSFVVTDTRRHDHPIIYCSPNFLALTGYAESEILGRNCRFLQSPHGIGPGGLGPGDPRPDAPTTSAAWHLKKCLDADKEVQCVITNYKKDGTPFTNHITVIPVPGGVSGDNPDEVVFQVGFQVDLTEQPSMILEKLKNGSYLVDYSSQNLFQGHKPPGSGVMNGVHGPGNASASAAVAVGTRERRTAHLPKITISKQMKRLLNDPGFVRSIPLTSTMTLPAPSSSGPSTVPSGDVYGGNHPLHFMLLETGPDFVHVVSLKGTFLYVAPSVRNILGYEPEDLAGKSISDLAHPEDVVPLMRELKESSTTGISAAGTEGTSSSSAVATSPTIPTSTHSQPVASGSSSAQATTSAIASNLPITSGHAPVQPRTVDLLFRARTKNGAYVWVESRGRLHVEPGKGRKAIILSGRAKEIPRLSWGMVARGGGLAKEVKKRVLVSSGQSNGIGRQEGGDRIEEVDVMQEFWATMSPSMVLLMLGRGFEDVLGWNADDWRGRNMKRLLAESAGLEGVVESLTESSSMAVDDDDDEQRSKNLEAKLVQTQCRMRHRDGRPVDVVVNVFKCERDPKVLVSTRRNPGGITPAPLIVQVRLVGAETYPLSSQRNHSAAVDLTANMFEELEISRGSSWQYELQQLKYANQRLRDDIRVLEAGVKGSLPPLAALPAARSTAEATSSSGLRSSVYNDLPERWSPTTTTNGGYYAASAPLPARASTTEASLSSRTHHHLLGQYDHYEPSTSSHLQDRFFDHQPQWPQQQQRQPQYQQNQYPPLSPHQSHPSTSTSVSTPATLSSLVDWPASTALGQSPFVQRIQQEALNAAASGSNRRVSSLKRVWGSVDGPCR